MCFVSASSRHTSLSASEIEAKIAFGLRAPDEARVFSKQNRASLDKIRDDLEAASFYAGLPPELRPLPPPLRRGGTDKLLDDICHGLQGYEGPIGANDLGSLSETPFNSGRVRDWVRQFGPVHAAHALEILKNVKFIGRTESNDALDSFFASEAGQPFQGGSVCPIGQAKDGAAIVAYHVGDTARRYRSVVRDLTDALAHSDPIALVDDFIGRGSSTLSILQALLGQTDSERLGEERPAPLSGAAQDALRSRKVAFVYAAGMDAGQSNLVRELGSLGFQDFTIHVGIDESEIPTLAQVGSAAFPDDMKTFSDRCASIGRQLIGVDDEEVEDRLLGYGNAGLLLVFAYNTPSASVTALWKSGEVDGWPWRPVFPRRKKL